MINIKAFQFEKRVHLKEKPLHLFGTFLIGMAFAAGWTPCIGPMLGSILIVASSQDTVSQGIALLAVYSAGLAIPFILMSVFINSMMTVMAKTRKYIGMVHKISGALLVALALLLIFDKIALLSPI